MKNISKKTKIIALLVAIIIIAGIIIILTKGLNFELKYETAQKIQLYLAKEFNISDIKKITDEIFPNQDVIIQTVEIFNETVGITVNNITDEQKSNLITKINEKYGTELQADEIEITNIPHTRGRDLIKPYITPFVVVTIIILIYLAIRYKKLGILRTTALVAFCIAIAQMLLLSIMAITRIPIGRITIPLVLIVYMLSLMGITTNFEKKLKEKNKEEEI